MHFGEFSYNAIDKSKEQYDVSGVEIVSHSDSYNSKRIPLRWKYLISTTPYNLYSNVRVFVSEFNSNIDQIKTLHLRFSLFKQQNKLYILIFFNISTIF